MRAKHTALILTAGFLMVPALSWSQFPGGPGGGMRGMSADPDQLFNYFSKGRDVIVVSELDGMQKAIFERMAPRMGLSGNEITREQVRGAVARATEMAKSGELSGMSFRSVEGGSPSGFAMQGAGGMTIVRPGGDTSDRDRRRDEYFKRLDRNEDGVLEYDELSGDPIAEGLQTERSKYDANSDGFIDQGEFKTYLTARFPSPEGGADNPGGTPGAPKDGDERKRPTIIRAGNLPRDFPYAAFDTDLDGQIGLYEWKNGGRKIAEFLPLDLNNDGFMTVEEFYRKRKEDSASASSQYGQGGRNGMNGAMAMTGQREGMPGMVIGQPGMGRGEYSRGQGMPGMGGPGSGMGGPGMGRGDYSRGQGMPGMGGPGSGMSGPGMGRGDYSRGQGMPGMGGPGASTPGTGTPEMGRGDYSRGTGAPGMAPATGGGATIPSFGGPGRGFTIPGMGSGATPGLTPPAASGGEQRGDRGSRGYRGPGGGEGSGAPGSSPKGDRKR